MEHPLISNIDHLTVDELTAKISDLNQKLVIASRTGNGHLCNQLRMALESFQSKFQQKVQKQYEENQENFKQKIKVE
jgi:hypothetical protein